MNELPVSRSDLEAFTQILAGMDADTPAKDLMSTIVTTISEVIGYEPDALPVTVTIEPEQLTTEPDDQLTAQFEGAFSLDAPAAHAVHVKVKKIGR
jgi:hypothetical protein